jgi:hypothetical protein
LVSDLKSYIARVTILGNISRRPTGSPSFDALGNRPRYFSSAAATMLGRARLRPEISASSVCYVPEAEVILGILNGRYVPQAAVDPSILNVCFGDFT